MRDKESDGRIYTIVIADDEEELRKAIIRKIEWEKIGFRIVGEAENGIEALELVEREEPDLLLSDIRMPFVSGIELARQVREIRPNIQIAFLSGYDEFSYAQQAIQYNIISYMLKPITMADLTAELQKIKHKIDMIFEEFEARKQIHTEVQEFVLPLLLDSYGKAGDSIREEQLQNQALFCGLIRSRENALQYTVLAVNVENKEGVNCTGVELTHSIDMILKKYVGFCSFYMEGRIISLLLATKGAFEKYLHIIVGDIVQSMERILGMNCHIGVSRSEEHLTECHKAYHDAMRALGYSHPGEKSSIHYIGDEERAAALDMVKVQDMMAELENQIRSGSEEELRICVKKIFRSMDSEPDLVMQKFFMMQMFSSVFRIVYAVTNDTALMQKMKLLDGSYQEMKEQFFSICTEARELVNAGKKKSSQILCEQTVRIIEKEYGNPDLSLVGVSARINVSPNYLSALMKKEAGMSFVDLLTKKRIETARELVTGSAMKVREIAEKCGYNDQHYFSYCFKKYCGISPNTMRQQNGNGAGAGGEGV